MVFWMDSFKWEHNRHHHRITLFNSSHHLQVGSWSLHGNQFWIHTKKKRRHLTPEKNEMDPCSLIFCGAWVCVWVCVCIRMSEHPRGRWEEKETLKFYMTLNVLWVRKLVNRAPGAGSFLSENKDKAPDFIFFFFFCHLGGSFWLKFCRLRNHRMNQGNWNFPPYRALGTIAVFTGDIREGY